MKHMTRKPLLPLLLLALMVFGTAFLSYFQADIAAGWDQIEHIYSDTQLIVELVPDSGWGNLQMQTYKDLLIKAMPEVADSLYMMECYYVLRDDTPLPEPEIMGEPVEAETAIIHGISSIDWLSEYWDLSITWHDGWDPDSFHVTDEVLPCLVTQEFLDLNGLKPGDVIEISPSPWHDLVYANAPRIPATVVGVCDEELGRIEDADLLVPEESFMSGPKLMYNADMMYRCYYRLYVLRLNQEYNREYDRIEDELEGILYDLSGFSFVSSAGAMENAARPLMQKLQMQELLVLPLSLLLCAATVVVAVLLGMSLDTEVFLRLMWGEKRGAVFARLIGLICLWLVVCGGAACAVSCLTAGAEWAAWAAGYSAVSAALCAAGAGLPLIKCCRSNLVKSYQSREGE